MTLIEIKNLNKTFVKNNNQCVVFDKANYRFPDKGFFALGGKSGSGKTTFLNLLLGIEKPTSGEIIYKNKNIKNFYRDEKILYYQNEIAIIFQRYNLFENLNAIDNVRIATNFTREKEETINALFEKFGLSNHKYSKVSTLSGGEKQRLAIIRALVKNPSILLADEPTGALDEKNSIILLEYLKEIAKTRLVIMITHNVKFAEQYVDEMIYIKDKQIVANLREKNANYHFFEQKNILFKLNILSLKKIIQAHFSQDIFKNCVVFISSLVAYLFLFLSVGFYNGIEISSVEESRKTLLYNFASISKEEIVHLESSSISLSKQTRPSIETMEELKNDLADFIYKPNLSYFLPSYIEVSTSENNFSTCALYPFFIDESVLEIISPCVNGRLPSTYQFNEIIVNRSYAELFSSNDVIGRQIIFRHDAICPFLYNDSLIQEKYSLAIPMTIVGVIDEFSFLSTPKIFYSYSAFESYLDKLIMVETSNKLGKQFSYLDYILSISDDSPISSYSYYLFFGKEGANHLTEYLDNFNDDNELTITSLYYENMTLYKNLMMSFATIFLLFSLIVLIVAILMLVLVSSASYFKRKRESAVLTILGIRSFDIYKIYFIENFIIVFLSYLASLIFSYPLEKLANFIIWKANGLSNIIAIPIFNYLNIPLLLPFSLFFIILISTFSVLFVIFFKQKNSSISWELKEE